MDVSHKITGQHMSGGDGDVSLNISLDVEHVVSWWKVDKGLLNSYFMFYIVEEIQPTEVQMPKTFHYWQQLNPNRNSIHKSVFQTELQGWLRYTRPIQIQFSSVSTCWIDTWRNFPTLMQWRQKLRSSKIFLTALAIAFLFILCPLKITKWLFFVMLKFSHYTAL